MVSMPFWCQLSCARRARTSSSEEAEIACNISRSPASGPPKAMNPSSTKASMNRACSSHPACWRRSRDQSQGPPRSRRTAKNTTRTLRRVPGLRGNPASCSRRLPGQPPDPAVVQPPELGLQPFAERHHRSGWMHAQEATHGPVERGHPDRMQPHASGRVRKVVVESVNDLNRHRVRQSTGACRGGAAAEVPQKGLRDPR